jgi:hypothetical protein
LKLQLLLVALVALSTRAAAAQIILSPSSPAVSLSVAETAEILTESGPANLIGYEHLVIAEINPLPNSPTASAAAGPSPVPEPAVWVIAGIGTALLSIGFWARSALRRVRRAVRRRRKETDREMAYI